MPGGPLVILTPTIWRTCRNGRSRRRPIAKPIFEFPGGRRFHFLDPTDTSWLCGQNSIRSVRLQPDHGRPACISSSLY